MFGLQRGVICVCGGEQQVTPWDHCDGPHSEACHDHERDSVPLSEKEHAHDTTTQEHPPYKEDVTANTAPLMLLSPAQPALLVMDFLERFMADRLVLESLLSTHALPWWVDEPSQNWPRVLSHTIVLRV